MAKVKPAKELLNDKVTCTVGFEDFSERSVDVPAMPPRQVGGSARKSVRSLYVLVILSAY